MDISQGAREILAHLEAIYQPTHDYVPAREADFPHLDLAFYNRVRAELEALGYVHLEDCEDRTLRNAPGNVLMPVFIRALLSRDGTIAAGLYHARIRPLWLRALVFVLRKHPGRTIDLETEFSDGGFVCTSNAAGASAISLPALIETDYLPRDTPLAPLLARHHARVADRMARTGATARRFTTAADVRAAQNRMNALKAAHRGEIGGITREELEKLSPAGRLLAHDVHAEIQQLHAATPPASTAGEGAPLTADDRLLRDIQVRGESVANSSSTGMLFATAVLFLALGGLQAGWQMAVFLVAAIGLHEIGHVLAMRVFGYKNVRMLFLPLFGGLATGEPRELDATKNALVALAGPAFGLFTTALAGGAAFLTGSPEWLVKFAWVSLWLNAFNLIPLVPLDGGQFTNDTLFSRYPILELGFRLVAIAGLGLLAFNWEAWLLGGLAVYMLLTTPVSYRRARIIRDARRDPDWQTRPLDREAVRLLRERVAAVFAGAPAEKYQPKLPEHVHGLWLEIRKRFPGPGRTAALLGAYAVLCLVVVPALAIFIVRFFPSPTFD